jgi:antitoxin HicB
MSALVKERNPHRGSSFDDFLKEEGIYQEVNSRAAMKAISENLKQRFNECQLTRTDFAKRMGSSRTAVNRLLDGDVESVTLKTLVKAASALGAVFDFKLRTHPAGELEQITVRKRILRKKVAKAN